MNMMVMAIMRVGSVLDDRTQEAKNVYKQLHRKHLWMMQLPVITGSQFDSDTVLHFSPKKGVNIL